MRLGSDQKASFLKIRLLRKKVLWWISDRNRNGNILEPLDGFEFRNTCSNNCVAT